MTETTTTTPETTTPAAPVPQEAGPAVATADPPAKGKAKKKKKTKETPPAAPTASEAPAENKEASETAALAQSVKAASDYRCPLPEAEWTDGQRAAVVEARKAWSLAMEHARPGEAVMIDPRRLLVVGLDTPEDQTDPLSDPDSVQSPIDTQWVTLFEVAGWQGSAASVVVRDGAPYLHDGRTRTRHDRKAIENLITAGKPVEPRNMAKVLILSGDLTGGDANMLSGALQEYRREETSMGKARRARRMFRHTGENYDATALGMRCTKQQVINYVKLAAAPTELQRAVDSDKIPMTSMLQILRLKQPVEQIQCLRDLLDPEKPKTKGDLSVPAVTAYVKGLLGETDDSATSRGGGRGSGKPREPGFVKGRAPKKRFVGKVLERYLSKQPEGEETAEADLVTRLIRWVCDGDSPPKILSGAVTAILNAEAKE